MPPKHGAGPAIHLGSPGIGAQLQRIASASPWEGRLRLGRGRGGVLFLPLPAPFCPSLHLAHPHIALPVQGLLGRRLTCSYSPLCSSNLAALNCRSPFVTAIKDAALLKQKFCHCSSLITLSPKRSVNVTNTCMVPKWVVTVVHSPHNCHRISEYETDYR